MYEIGKRYKVPCVKLIRDIREWGRDGEYVPVLLPKHNDKETINFPHEHYHLDWRFATKRQWKRAADNRLGEAGAFAIVLSDTKPMDYRDDIIYRLMQCRREFPMWPHQHTPWKDQLESEYVDKRVPACGKCPHRGVDLSTVEVKIIDLGKPSMRCVNICPGHGLVWDAESGQNVSYKELYQP